MSARSFIPDPKPAKREKRSAVGLKRSEIGAKVKTRVQWEQQQAMTLEGSGDRLGLFQLYHLDWLHLSTPMRDKGTLQAGHPDYLLLGDGPAGPWSAYLEIKARNLETKRMGSLQANQRVFHDKLRACGHEVMVAYLPDDFVMLNEWIGAKTGRVVELQ